jgi:hypothetical protein
VWQGKYIYERGLLANVLLAPAGGGTRSLETKAKRALQAKQYGKAAARISAF